MPTQAVESGVSRQEFYFVRETTDSAGDPVAPSDPTFLLYSSAVQNFSAEGNPNYEARSGLGEWIGQDKTRQQEDNTLSVSYDLEKFFVDGSGNANDAFYDISKRNIDNQVEATHSVLRVEEFDELAAENTVHFRYFEELGNTHPATDPEASPRATRKETYGRGCIPEEGVLTANPGDSATVGIEMSYIPTKLRPYQFDQPESSQTLHVRSSDPNDTGIDVEVETAAGSTTEVVTLDGSDATTPVSTTESYGSLRANVSADQQGYIEIYADDAGSPAQLLAVIPGKDARDGIESDNGPPLVGSGSFEDASATGIGSGVPAALAGDITFDGNSAAQYIGELELTVSNEVSDQTTSEGLTKFINAGGAEISLSSTVFGETENVDNWKRMLKGSEGELSLPLAAGDVDIPRTYVDEFSEEVEAGSSVATPETMFMVLEPSSGDPIQYTKA